MSQSCDRDAELLDDVPQRAGVVSHSDVASDDRDNLRRFAEQLCCGQVHRVERADWLDGKGAADASEHGPVDVEDDAAPRAPDAGGRAGEAGRSRRFREVCKNVCPSGRPPDARYAQR